MSKALILFDIDGTLMITKGAGSRCLHRAGAMVFGDAFEWTDITVGTLDPQIFEQLARHNAVEDPGKHLDQFRETYLTLLQEELQRVAQDITLMPGITSLLGTLYQRPDDAVLGLLTGNFTRAAEIKLIAAGFDLSRFPITAFAEDGRTRNDLPVSAMASYARHTGQPVAPSRTLIVGDTPRDIECARANGCTVLAVATGRYTIEQLQQAGGDIVVKDLSDPTPLLHWLDSQG